MGGEARAFDQIDNAPTEEKQEVLLLILLMLNILTKDTMLMSIAQDTQIMLKT